MVLDHRFAVNMAHRRKMVFGFCTKRTGGFTIMDDFVMSESGAVVLSTMVANNGKRSNERERARRMACRQMSWR